MIRVRFAPSPTGFVHVGGLRTALYNYLFAKRNNGRFILRIEDTDRSRFIEGATNNIIKVLNWAGLIPDEGPEQGGGFGPYFQSQRTQLYRQFAEQLLRAGYAYYAFDTPEEIDKLRQTASERNLQPKYDSSTRMSMRNSLSLSDDQVRHNLETGIPHVIRLLIPENRTFTVHDLIRGQVTFHSSQVDDQVLIKSDGFPTYHLANVVDDHLMEISHVIRGEEWLSSVPKHLYLYECLGWNPPEMAHLPLIFNPDGTKMSKRDIQSLSALPTGKVDPDVQSYINAGYEKDAIVNHIALLGWNPGDDRELFSLQELVDHFSLERVNKAAAIFDIPKLNHINQQHLSRKSASVLAREVLTELSARGITAQTQEYLEQVVKLMQPRLYLRNQFFEASHYFFLDPETYDADVVKKRWTENSAKYLLEFVEEIAKLELFDKNSLETALQVVASRNTVNAGQVIHPVRLAATGVGAGPGLYELLELLGKERVINRLKKAAQVIPLLQKP
ncbi:MAG: glutamate--tRNA ligase [Calditrichaeota bacterium]|nr:MAG: glutamate--tRNA ligase [Calditrichota bacterium]